MVRQIIITPVLNGFVVDAGCQRVVFSSVDQLAEEVRKYYKDPHATEKSYIRDAVNKTMDNDPMAARTATVAVDRACAQDETVAAECDQRTLVPARVGRAP